MTGGFDLLGSLMSGASPEQTARDTTTAAHRDAPGTPGSAPPVSDGALPCSARGCAADAEFGLRWNNPRIHAPERRKTWLACGDHRSHLAAFLADRGFLKETVDVAELPGLDGPADRADVRRTDTPTCRGGDAE